MLIRNILSKRREIPKTLAVELSRNICEKILSLKEYHEAENLMVYYAYLGEADIQNVILDAFSKGKNVYFPKVTGETSMEFVKVYSLSDFSCGYKNIMEPIGTEKFIKNPVKGKTLMILPGSVFDYSGNRCGYGKGYYDRYLADCYTEIIKVGVCFDMQMVEMISDVKSTDIVMDYVVNEKMIYRSEKSYGNA